MMPSSTKNTFEIIASLYADIINLYDNKYKSLNIMRRQFDVSRLAKGNAKVLIINTIN